jgi:hypothetical protein
MNRNIVVLCLLSALFGSAAALAQEPIENLLRQVPPGEGVSIGYSPMYPSLDLPAVATLADLAVEGEVVSAVSEQTPGPTYVSTTYVLRVTGVLFDRAPLAKTLTPGISTITFVRIGGRISIEGRQVITQDTSLRDFENGEYLFLFLKRDRKDGSFAMVGGPCGAFSVQVQEGTIRSFQGIGMPLSDKYAGLDAATFRTRVMAAATVVP